MSLLGFLVGKVRCPRCGAYERHPRDLAAEREEGEHQRRMKELGWPKSMQKDGTPRAFVCAECEHRFDLDSEVRWARLAKQTSEAYALKSYAEVMSSFDKTRQAAGKG